MREENDIDQVGQVREMGGNPPAMAWAASPAKDVI